MTSLNKRTNRTDHDNAHFYAERMQKRRLSAYLTLLNLVILAFRFAFIYNFAKITNLPNFV